jgi:hypothetical protein
MISVPYYCVNTNAQSTGDHEVHDVGSCTRLPNEEHRMDLGWHANCHGAVKKAKETYNTANGCAYCSPDCNTG